MKSFLIVALTTLFVSFMPHQAAYGAGDPQGMAPQGDCTTLDMIISPEDRAKQKDQGARFEEITSQQYPAVKAVIEAAAGPFPTPSENLLLYIFGTKYVILAFSKEGCFVFGTIMSAEGLSDVLKAMKDSI